MPAPPAHRGRRRRPAPEVAAILGLHYAIAEHADRAVHYLELLDDATDAFANDEAVASFREALAVTERAGDELKAAAVQLTPSSRTSCGARRAAMRPATPSTRRCGWRARGPRPLDPALRAYLHIRLGRLEMQRNAMPRRPPPSTPLRHCSVADAGSAGSTDDAATDQWLELMIDGWASMHLWCLELDRALAVLEQVRPVLEAHGSPARNTAFYRFWTLQKLLRNRLRVDEEDLANLHAAIAAAENPAKTGTRMSVRDGIPWLGAWLRGDLAAAAEGRPGPGPGGADRRDVLRDLALIALTLIALACMTPRRCAPCSAASGRPRRSARNLTAASRQHVRRGLAGLAGDRPDEVLRLAAEIESLDLTNIGSAAIHGGLPVPGARRPARRGRHRGGRRRRSPDHRPSQQLLPDDLTSALAAACGSWTRATRRGRRGTSRRRLTWPAPAPTSISRRAMPPVTAAAGSK